MQRSHKTSVEKNVVVGQEDMEAEEEVTQEMLNKMSAKVCAYMGVCVYNGVTESV